MVDISVDLDNSQMMFPKIDKSVVMVQQNSESVITNSKYHHVRTSSLLGNNKQ